MQKKRYETDLGYVDAVKLRSMHDGDILFVHPAVISERLRCFDVDREENASSLRTKLERKLFSVTSVRRRTLCGWSERVAMTVSDVRILFGEIEHLPLRALKRKY